MAVSKYDLVVIGSGPAGEAAAMSAAKKGLRSAVIERRSAVGGNCTHKGTIPSKALRHSVKQLMRYNTQSVFRALGEPRRLTFPQVMRTVNKVINYQVEMHTSCYARNRVDLINGEAKFLDENRVEVQLADGAKETVLTPANLATAYETAVRVTEIDGYFLELLRRPMCQLPVRVQGHPPLQVCVRDHALRRGDGAAGHHLGAWGRSPRGRHLPEPDRPG